MADAKFEKECLESHNKYRALHGCPPLQLSKPLSQFANEWAQKLAKSGKPQHRSNNEYGENIFMAVGHVVTGEQAVKAWYDEVKLYNFGAAKFSPTAGHFTQLVWKASKELGVGLAKKGDATFVVVNYNPPGNVEGEFEANVPKRLQN